MRLLLNRDLIELLGAIDDNCITAWFPSLYNGTYSSGLCINSELRCGIEMTNLGQKSNWGAMLFVCKNCVAELKQNTLLRALSDTQCMPLFLQCLYFQVHKDALYISSLPLVKDERSRYKCTGIQWIFLFSSFQISAGTIRNNKKIRRD